VAPVDAQNGWLELVAAANNAFENSHNGWKVNVQYQQWNDHLQKFDATIAGNDTPDVIEMGNTDMTAYMAAGEFANLGPYKSSFDNSAKWLGGLKASSTFDGALRSPHTRLAASPTAPTSSYAGFTKPPKRWRVPERESSRSGRCRRRTLGSPSTLAVRTVHALGRLRLRRLDRAKSHGAVDLASKKSLAGG
jgi:hypothetical protein